MKKTLVFGLAALVAGNVVHAGDFSLSADVTLTSEYIFRGIKLGEISLQPSIVYTQDEFYGGVWVNQPLEERNSAGYSDEIDFYVGYTPQLSDNVSLDLGGTYYYYPEGNASASTELFVGANFTLDTLTPGVYVYYDLDLEVLTVQGNLGFSIPLDAAGTSLDLALAVGSAQPDEGESYTYYSVGASVPYKLNEYASVKVGVNWASHTLDGVDDNHLWFTAGLTVGY
jgi:uncharacterized protein (TIGR02001 family)